jgi:hypothetical protein
MSDKDIDFPQYRKLSNDKVFYCVLSELEFHEIQIIGTKANLFKFRAKQYPEKLKIIDLLNFEDAGIIRSNQDEYEKLLMHYSLG